MAIKPIIIEGLKTWSTDHPTIIDDLEVADAQNMVRAADGLWENRLGIETFENEVGTDEPVHSVYFWRNDSGDRYLTVGSGTALYSYAEGSAYNDGTFTSRQTGFTDGAPFDFFVYKNILVASNGEENMYSTTDNTTFTIRNGADTVIAPYVLNANNIVYAFGNGSILYDSDASPANPWEFPQNTEIGDGNGFVGTALTNLGPLVIAGKEVGINQVNIAATENFPLDEDGGISSNRSIVKAANNIYFAALEGIRILSQREGTTGSLQVDNLSDGIESLWQQVTNKDSMPGYYWPAKRQIYWFAQVPTGDVVLVYNVKWKAWSYYVGMNIADFTTYIDSDGGQHLIYGDSNTDKVREMEVLDRSDDGAPITSVLTTKRYNFGTNELKEVNFLALYGFASELFELDIEVFVDDDDQVPLEQGTINSNYFTDDDVAISALGDDPIGDTPLANSAFASDDLPVRPWKVYIPIERPFRNIQVRMTNAQAGVRWRFLAMGAYVNALPEDLKEPQFFLN